MKKIMIISFALLYSTILVCQKNISKTEIFNILENKTNGIYFISFDRPDCKPSESMKPSIEYLFNKHNNKVQFYNYNLQNEIFVFPKEHIVWNEEDTPKDLKFHQTPTYAIIHNGLITHLRSGTFGERFLKYFDETLTDYYNQVTKRVEEKYDNGQISNVYFLNNLNQKTGVEKYFYETGELDTKITWSDDTFKEYKLEEIEYHKNGNIATKKKYGHLGWPEGDWYRYYPTGELYFEGNFDNMYENAYFTQFYKSGKVFRKIRVLYLFDDEFSIIKEEITTEKEIDYIIEIISYFESGSIGNKQYYVVEDNNLKKYNSFQAEIIENSGMFDKAFEKDGFYFNHEPAGTEKVYFENGNIYYEADYKFGKLNGFIKHFYNNGNLQSKISTENGMYIDLVSYFNYQGLKIDGGSLKNGNGTLTMRNVKNGDIENIFHFENGKATKKEKQ